MATNARASTVSAATLEVVTSEFDYEQLEEVGIGQGRNSRVFRAFDPQQGGEIAVKEIPKTNFPDPAAYFGEAQAMRRADCPNVVPIRAASTAGDRICLVMPYLRNGSLLTRIQNGPLRPKDAIRVGQGMLKGLSQIHIANVIHFDLKPSNVLFSDTDEALIADFGQSRVASASGATPIPSLYIPAMPPEAFQRRHGDRLSDIFQAGLTLYRALNGEPNYSDQLAACSDIPTEICRGRFPDRDGYLPHVPRWLRLVVNKAMKVDPANRHASASDFAMALGRHPINLDWIATPNGADSMDWEAARKNKPNFVVRRFRRSGANSIEVYTRTGKVLRAKDKTVLWRSGLDEKAATEYLKSLFRTMEQA